MYLRASNATRDALVAYNHRLATAEAAEGWRDIRTAPTAEEAHIIVITREDNVYGVHRDGAYWFARNVGRALAIEDIVGWIPMPGPLPPAPSGTDEGVDRSQAEAERRFQADPDVVAVEFYDGSNPTRPVRRIERPLPPAPRDTTEPT
jgi:hypothetical protein